MNFLQKQVTYFINQFQRIKSFNKTINGKLGKNEAFVNASKYVLSSLGMDKSIRVFIAITETVQVEILTMLVVVTRDQTTRLKLILEKTCTLNSIIVVLR